MLHKCIECKCSDGCPGNLGVGCFGDWRCCREMNDVCKTCKSVEDLERCEYYACDKMEAYRLKFKQL